MNLTIQKNDRKASIWIILFSVIVFVSVTVLERVTLPVDLGFNPHFFCAGERGDQFRGSHTARRRADHGQA